MLPLQNTSNAFLYYETLSFKFMFVTMQHYHFFVKYFLLMKVVSLCFYLDIDMTTLYSVAYIAVHSEKESKVGTIV